MVSQKTSALSDYDEVIVCRWGNSTSTRMLMLDCA